jgi:hypothetical protein
MTGPPAFRGSLLRWRLAASAFVDPKFLVVFPMIHHLQDIHDSLWIIHSSNQSEAVIAHVKHNAVPHLIGRRVRLPERRELIPLSVLGYFVPCGQISFSSPGIAFSGLPKLTQPSLRDNSHIQGSRFQNPRPGECTGTMKSRLQSPGSCPAPKRRFGCDRGLYHSDRNLRYVEADYRKIR